MGNDRGKFEIDERGRLMLPSKEIIFKELVGCIKIPSEEIPTPESIKKIWKLKE